jgi:hypothetical protein
MQDDQTSVFSRGAKVIFAGRKMGQKDRLA